MRLDALVIQQGRLTETTKGVNKDDLLSMVRYGAEMVFNNTVRTSSACPGHGRRMSRTAPLREGCTRHGGRAMPLRHGCPCLHYGCVVMEAHAIRWMADTSVHLSGCAANPAHTFEAC